MDGSDFELAQKEFEILRELLTHQGLSLIHISGTLLLILAVAVLGSGAGWYFKIYRPKHEKAAVPEEDYSEELADYDDPEDDGPPWDEDDTESEDNE